MGIFVKEPLWGPLRGLIRAVPGRAWLMALTAFVIILPLLVVRMPPLVDYPNHLVRFWLLSGGIKNPFLSQFFAVDWGQSATNIGIDLIAAGLGSFLAVPITGRVILALAALLPALGVGLLGRAVHGRFTPWHILAGLVAWPVVLLSGFMSLQLAFGLALIAAAMDVRLEKQSLAPRLIRQTLQALIITIVHPFGVIFYGVLLCGLAFGRSPLWRGDEPVLSRARGLFLNVLPVAAALGLIAIRIKLFGQGGDGNPEALGRPELIWYERFIDSFSAEHVVRAFIGPLRSYSVPVDIVFMALLWVPIVVAIMQKRLVVHFGLCVVGAGIFLLGIIAPQSIGSTSMVDVRFWTMALLILPACVLPQAGFRWRHSSSVLIGLALFCLAGRSLWLGAVWSLRQEDVASLYRALDHLPEDSRLLPAVAKAEPEGEAVGRWLSGISPTYPHMSTLAVIRRHAYVPSVFAEPGKQPLRVLPPYDQRHEISGGLLTTLEDLRTEKGHINGYVPGWRSHFDYVMVVDAYGSSAGDYPSGLCLVADEGFARLYQVRQTCGPQR